MLVPRALPLSTLRSSFILLGVQFRHPAPVDRATTRLVASLAQVTGAIEGGTEEARRRQKRGGAQYIDALTAFDRMVPTPSAHRSGEENLLRELLPGLATQNLPSALLLKLWSLPALAFVRSSVLPLPSLLHEAVSGRNRSVNGGRGAPGGEAFDAKHGLRGRFTAPGDGVFRILELDLEEASGEDVADWPRLVSVAVLAQLRADLEIWLETGFLRVRKCQHEACGAWFFARRMAGRQRFCSAYCRVAHSRKS